MVGGKLEEKRWTGIHRSHETGLLTGQDFIKWKGHAIHI